MSALARRIRAATIAVVASSCLLAGCADFSATDRSRSAGEFSPDDKTAVLPSPPAPSIPSETPDGPQPTGPCVDPDPAVIATCLDSTSAVLPGQDPQGTATVVSERRTGNIIATRRNGPKTILATIPVDAGGDGGLMDFAPSPAYQEDRLFYAYISTPTDNRVVRVAPGDAPKPILVGIPKGPTGNVGSLRFRSPDELLVATGDAGNPAAAADPASLAGKLLSITDLTSGNSTRPKIVASGLGTNATICSNVTTGRLYLTDRAPTEDRLQVIDTSGTLRPLWTWPDKPQISGCAAVGDTVAVTTARTQHVELLSEPTREKPTVTKPVVALEKRYGALGRMAALPSGVFQIGTVNKDGGRPGPTDERVFRFIPPTQSQSNV
ncbi:PQQ-dependent sugar dehydrogenase [Williamsia sp. CHRR-6]|uniref:PQQ-dependent sugar dehydrogenase n=1 Tax=Williamsia sp. CHRR-6 TaxID=2835871 RepID=UPI001BDA9907|nr:PQQ-dependent sugar dehydrogenase [Williamsia sp. CHRR-6]MBT0565456.1 PQQ-dependent sugar dehydrogenase [Williamsia sp. CHRR-6]